MPWIFAMGFMVGGIYKVRQNALSKYISIDKSKTSRLKVEHGKTYSLAEVMDGEVEIDIEDALFRIVCCNRERYQYLQTQSRSRNWVSMHRDFNGHVIYERKVSRIAVGSRLADYLPKQHDISFDVMFRNLYPQALVSKTYGAVSYTHLTLPTILLV